MIVVSDTSPITSLIAIKRIDLLKKLCDEVTIPPAVRDELEVCHSNLPSFLRVIELNTPHGNAELQLGNLDIGN